MSKGQFVKIKDNQQMGSMAQYRGQVIDLETKEPLPAAQINVIRRVGDSTSVKMYVADRQGYFKFSSNRGFGRNQHNERIEVICLGYKVFEMLLPSDFTKSEFDLGKIRLEHDVQKADEAVVKGRLVLYKMKGDTTLIFPAAIKQMKGDALVDLLRRHPLFSVNSKGEVFFNGQLIERVDVNGRLLFGEDAVTAVKSLNAADVHLLKSYEENDEISEILKGKENSRRRRVLSVITFKTLTSVQAGNILLAGGVDRNEDIAGEKNKRYAAIGDIGSYNDTLRLSLNGGVDNRPNVGVDPLFGISIPTQYQRNANFGGNISISTPQLLNQFNVGYHYSSNFNEGRSESEQEYFISQQFNKNKSFSSNDKATHAFNLKLNRTKKEKSSIVLTYNGQVSNEDILSQSARETFIDNQIANNYNRTSKKDEQFHNHKMQIVWTKRLGKKRHRALSLEMWGHYNRNKGLEIREDTTVSMSNSDWKLLSISNNSPKLQFDAKTNVAIGKFISYLSFSFNDSKQRNIAYNEYTMQFDSVISNDIDRKISRFMADAQYRIKLNQNTSLLLISRFQIENNIYNDLLNKQKIKDMKYWVMPGLSISNNRSQKIKWRLSLQGRRSSLAPTYLSPHLEVLNPMNLRAGNPNLKPSMNYSLSLGLNVLNGIGLEISDHISSNSPIRHTRYFSEDTILPEYGNYKALAGSQLNTWTNGKTSHSVNVGINWKKYLYIMTVGFNANYKFVNPEAQFNGQSYREKQDEFSIGAVINSNFSNSIRLDIEDQFIYRSQQNATQDITESFKNQLIAKMRCYIGERFDFNASYIYDIYRSALANSDVDNNMLNLSLSCRIFKDRQGVLSFNAYDVLNKTSTSKMSVTNLFSSRQYNQNFSSYFTISFSYRFNRF